MLWLRLPGIQHHSSRPVTKIKGIKSFSTESMANAPLASSSFSSFRHQKQQPRPSNHQNKPNQQSRQEETVTECRQLRMSAYDTVSAPKPVPLRYLSKASIQSVMMGCEFSKPEIINNYGTSSQKQMSRGTTHNNPSSTNVAIHSLRKLASHCTSSNTKHGSISQSKDDPGSRRIHQDFPISFDINSSKAGGETTIPHLHTSRSPDDSLPPIPQQQQRRSHRSFLPSALTSRSRIPNIVVESPCPSPVLFPSQLDQSCVRYSEVVCVGEDSGAANNSSILEDDVVWSKNPSRQSLHSPDAANGSYLDMSRSDISAFSSKLDWILLPTSVVTWANFRFLCIFYSFTDTANFSTGSGFFLQSNDILLCIEWILGN